MGGRRRRTTGLIGAALVAAFIMTGCSASGSQSADSAAAGTSDQRAAAPLAPAEGKDQPAEAPDLSVVQRSIIYTGSITIRVKDVNQAAARATAIATGAGGFVGGDKRDTSDGSSDATVVLRIPADRFQAVVNQLATTLGTEQQRGISTEDVTEQTVDLDARIAVQQARVDSGRKLLGQAKSLDDLVMLEREVATRESDLASLQGKKRHLADLTALSTITVVLLDPKAEAATKDDGPPGFLAGLLGGWKALVASLAVLLTVLGALLPWLIGIGIPAWALFYAYRRYLRRPRGPATALATAGAPLPTFLPGAYPSRPGPADRRARPEPPPASPAGPATTDQTGPTTTGQTGPTTVGQAGPATESQAGPTTPGQAGPITPGQAGPATAGQAGPATAGQAGPTTVPQGGSAIESKSGIRPSGTTPAAGAAPPKPTSSPEDVGEAPPKI